MGVRVLSVALNAHCVQHTHITQLRRNRARQTVVVEKPVTPRGNQSVLVQFDMG